MIEAFISLKGFTMEEKTWLACLTVHLLHFLMHEKSSSATSEKRISESQSKYLSLDGDLLTQNFLLFFWSMTTPTNDPTIPDLVLIQFLSGVFCIACTAVTTTVVILKSFL